MRQRESRQTVATVGGGQRGDDSFQRVSSRHYTTTGQSNGQAVFNAQGKPIGYIDRDGWLVKTHLDPDKHMLRKPEGWASDAAHVALPIKGMRLVTVAGVVWEASIEAWRCYGIPLDRGFGRQVVLPVRYWQLRQAGDGRQLAFALGV